MCLSYVEAAHPPVPFLLYPGAWLLRVRTIELPSYYAALWPVVRGRAEGTMAGGRRGVGGGSITISSMLLVLYKGALGF